MNRVTILVNAAKCTRRQKASIAARTLPSCGEMKKQQLQKHANSPDVIHKNYQISWKTGPKLYTRTYNQRLLTTETSTNSLTLLPTPIARPNPFCVFILSSLPSTSRLRTTYENLSRVHKGANFQGDPLQVLNFPLNLQHVNKRAYPIARK